MSFSHVVQAVKDYRKLSHDLPELRIGLIGNVVVSRVTPYIELRCFQAGFKPTIYVGENNDVLLESMLGALYVFKPDVIIVVFELENMDSALSKEYLSLSTTETIAAETRALTTINSSLKSIRNETECPIIINNFRVHANPTLGVLDTQLRNGQRDSYRRLNDALLDLIQSYKDVYIVDFDLIQSRIGEENFFDPRYWYVASIPYTIKGSAMIAREYMKLILALKGKTKKMLVLDCDNTLWGGVIGEDGIDGIILGEAHPGLAYTDFHRAIIELYKRGVMLGLCSKNNMNDVLEVLRNHPSCLLKEEHFVSMKINWVDKVANMKQMAEELNIGLDSFVFVDDSSFEIEMVNQLLPEVTTILLPKDTTKYTRLLYEDGLFDSLTYSAEDKKRTGLYRAERMRQTTSSTYETLEEFYESLHMVVSIGKVNGFVLPRISQLTQRTNQFNLTTRRYSIEDIKGFMASSSYEVLYLKLKDEFGDMGVVGTAILVCGDDCLIDTFLLSCRVIGRGVETILLQECMETAKRRGYAGIYGEYMPTKKNRQTENFYSDNGFRSLSGSTYRSETNRELDSPSYFAKVNHNWEDWK